MYKLKVQSSFNHFKGYEYFTVIEVETAEEVIDHDFMSRDKAVNAARKFINKDSRYELID